MSKKNKKGKSRESNAQLLERAERELAKGNAKSALKDAKVAFRNEPTSGARQLLESAWAERVEQLQRQKLLDEARAALHELLDFKPTDPAVCERLPRLQVLIGDKNADAAALFAQQPELLVELADRAILDWDCLPPEHASIPAQVTAVRQALSAVEAGDDARATALLNDIPRTSHVGEWKLFVRGLAAFYQRDQDRMTANWQRLDPGRPPHRIARTLQAAAGDLSTADAPDVAANAKRLDTLLGGGAAYEQLVSLGEFWRNGDWRSLVAELRRFRHRHAKTHHASLQRIADLVWRRAIREGNRNFFGRLSGLLPAPELDPHWHRVRALFAEDSRECDTTAVEAAWKAYAQDLRSSPLLREDERPIAEALIYLRLGRKFLEFAESSASRMQDSWADEDDSEAAREVEYIRKLATQFLRHSIQIYPRLTDAYRDLATLHEESEDIEKAAAIYEKLLKQAPDDFAAQLWLARYYLERDEPNKAESFTAAARRLKPRDPQCLALSWTQQVTMVRCLTKKRKLDEARAELEKLHAVRPPDVDRFVLDLIAAAIEFKAKNEEAAQQFVDLAVSRLDEPTIVWLQMSSIAARYGLSRDVKKLFDERYKDAIEKPPTSQTAGLLALFFSSLKVNQINYTGRATQERLAIAYLTRATKAKNVPWNEIDLTRVCEWLGMLPRQTILLNKLLSLGLHAFPNSPRLSFVAGSQEMRHGYFYNIEFAADCFRAAIKNHAQASLTLSPPQLDFAKESLSRLEEMLGREDGLGARFEFDEDEEDEYDEYDDEDEDFDGYHDDFNPSEGLPSGADLDTLIKTAPPFIIKALKKMAAATGMNVEEVLAQALQMGVPSSGAPDTPKPRRRRHASQSNQPTFTFDDE